MHNRFLSFLRKDYWLKICLVSLLVSSCGTPQLAPEGATEQTVTVEVEQSAPGNQIPDEPPQPTSTAATETVAEKNPSVAETASAAESMPAPTPTIPTPEPVSTTTDVNRFNRLLQKYGEEQRRVDDGIYDLDNPANDILQKPADAFRELPKTANGADVDWVKALQSGAIQPRSDLHDPQAKPFVMDLDIVRQVKGSMPDVVFPHKEHTEILDCTNCHPGIFIPQKGANQISMAKNLKGEMCGICHGKVAFPLSRCTACHSERKPMQEVEKTKWEWP
jgi:c(7)-type cytochrome triheme protein